jgi:hypothetical protein
LYYFKQVHFMFLNLNVKQFLFCVVDIAVIVADQSKEDELGGACGALGGDEGCIQHFGWEA